MQATNIANQLAALQENRSLKSMASSNNGNTTGNDSASIGANDFLTLLVTEMKNQDPTANTDPNEYINQLVQVNSLEQLISINQTLQTDSAAGSNVKASAQHAISSVAGSTGSHVGSLSAAALPASVQSASGNLSIPLVNDAAARVAQSLLNH